MIREMGRHLLVRHAKARANERDFTAFGNIDSPLVEGEKGIPRAKGLNKVFREKYGIIPEIYNRPVASSVYTRSQQTLELAGFVLIHTHPILNETVFDRGGLSPEAVVRKHIEERWVPREAAERAAWLIESMRTGEFQYEVSGSHGILTASVKMQLVDEALAAGAEPPYEFAEFHGYIPDFATIVPVEV